MSGKMLVNTLVASGVMLASLLGPSEMSTRLAEQDKTAQAAVSKAETPTVVEKKANAPRGRLPRYYSAVVDPGQRDVIYQIQSEFRMQREGLEKQLAELKQQEQEAILAVLETPQKKMIQELRREAEVKRLARQQEVSSKAAADKATAIDAGSSTAD